MITIYDFKVIPSREGFSIENADEKLLWKVLGPLAWSFAGENYDKGKIKNRISPEKIISEIKILKKSVDLRQKEARTVFRAVISLEGLSCRNWIALKKEHKATAPHNHDELESLFVGFLLKHGIKARISNSEDKQLLNKHEDTGEPWKHKAANEARVVIVGAGPAGIFAAVRLLEKGIKPIILEKGRRVEERINDIENLFQKAEFNKNSNIVFGEGGAGTFSDGKLTTRKSDILVGYVLNFLVKMGADKSILTVHKPHLGSDNLINILKNIRNFLVKHGAEIYFEEEMKGFEFDDKKGIRFLRTDKRRLEAERVILATGSNSYDTYEMLDREGVSMERKPFSAGFRIEHKRDFIDRLFFKGNKQDGVSDSLKLSGVYYNISSAKYGGYSFCMCPGGVVVNASSEESMLSVNGMSYSGRDLENSNSAIVSAVRPEMLDMLDKRKYGGPMGSLKFRKELELMAFKMGGGNFTAPFQYSCDYINDVYKIKESVKGKDIISDKFEEGLFCGNEEKRFNLGLNINSYADYLIKDNPFKLRAGVNSEYSLPKPSYRPSTIYSAISGLLPLFLNFSIASSLIEFEGKFSGFAGKSVLTGIETGTSSAVRIKRNEGFESVSFSRLYPCGEGSGYSGGIVTSAVDGIRCADALVSAMQ